MIMPPVLYMYVSVRTVLYSVHFRYLGPGTWDNSFSVKSYKTCAQYVLYVQYTTPTGCLHSAVLLRLLHLNTGTVRSSVLYGMLINFSGWKKKEKGHTQSVSYCSTFGFESCDWKLEFSRESWHGVSGSNWGPCPRRVTNNMVA